MWRTCYTAEPTIQDTCALLIDKLHTGVITTQLPYYHRMLYCPGVMQVPARQEDFAAFVMSTPLTSCGSLNAKAAVTVNGETRQPQRKGNVLTRVTVPFREQERSTRLMALKDQVGVRAV